MKKITHWLACLCLVKACISDAQVFNLSFAGNGQLLWTNTVCSPCTCLVEQATSPLGPWHNYTNVSASNRTVEAFVPMTGSNQLFFRVAAVSTLGSNLLGYWPLAGDARDISGHGYHGIATNLVWTTNRLATSNASALFVNNPQQWANAFAHVAISNAPGLCPTNSLSVTAWFNTFDPLGRHIVSKEFNSGMEDSFVLWFEFGTALRFQIEVTNSFANVGIVSPPTDGQWHFVAGTWDGQWIKIYLDGIPRDTNWLTGGMVWDDHPIRIGADDNNGDYIADEGWDGLINEVRIYGRALSDDEVRQIYLLPW